MKKVKLNFSRSHVCAHTWLESEYYGYRIDVYRVLTLYFVTVVVAYFVWKKRQKHDNDDQSKARKVEKMKERKQQIEWEWVKQKPNACSFD